MKNSSPLAIAILLGSLGAAFAGPLQEAKINQIVNDVKVVDPQKGARPAALQDTVRDQIAVRTGIKSRAELLFQDATLTRLGAETFFSFKSGTRDLSLDRGTMLLQVPKGRGGARIRTASVTASITGTTIMLENEPGKHLKVLVLEGSLRLSVNGRFGEAITLQPGKMIIMEANAKTLPNPVDVDLRKIVKTSALVDAALFKGDSRSKVAPLPSLALIDKEIASQEKRIAAKRLVPTNLVIAGKGTNVIAATDEQLSTLESDGAVSRVSASATVTLAQNATQAPSSSGTSVTGARDTRRVAATTPSMSRQSSLAVTSPTAAGTGVSASATVQDLSKRLTAATITTSPSSSGSGSSGSSGGTSGSGSSGTSGGGTTPVPPFNVASATDLVVGNVTSVTGAITVLGAIIPSGGVVSGLLPYSVSASGIQAGNGFRLLGADGTSVDAPHAGGYLTYLFAPEIKFSPTGINGALLMGGDAVTGDGGNGGALWIGSLLKPIPGVVEFDALVNVSTGANGGATTTGGTGGRVSALSDDRIKVSSTIMVSDSAPGLASARGGGIYLTSRKTGGTAIRIENSGQLLALLDAAAPGPGGIIKISSSGGRIEVDGGRLQADRGTVDVRNSDSNGTIALTNANIRGDTVKIGALGSKGQLLIGGGTINADTTLKLYGGTSGGQVRFTDDVTLGGAGAKIIAGKRVTIDNGRTVTIGGSSPANVYTSTPNYTGSGGNGSTTGQFGGAGATTQNYGSRPAF